jgi:hypothetical protein
MDFVRFNAASGKGNGMIDEQGLITADSSNTFMEWFCAGFARVTGNTINEEARKKIYEVNTMNLNVTSFPLTNYSVH